MSKRTPVRPVKQFVGARVALWAATLILGAFGAIGWGLALWPVSPALGVTAAIVAMIAPVVAAALTGPAAHGAGLSAWLCILIFTAMDAGSNANAAWQFDAAANASVNRPAIEAHAADVAAAKAVLATAQAKLAALPTPDAQGAIRKADTYATAHAALVTNVATAQAALDALKAPEPVALFPRWLSGGVMALTSFALILGHLAVATASRKDRERHTREVAALREQARAATPGKPKAHRKRKPRVPQGPNVVPFKKP